MLSNAQYGQKWCFQINILKLNLKNLLVFQYIKYIYAYWNIFNQYFM